jgi:hypothetical protein
MKPYRPPVRTNEKRRVARLADEELVADRRLNVSPRAAVEEKLEKAQSRAARRFAPAPLELEP